MAKGNEILLEISADTKSFNSQMKATSKKIDGLTKKTKKAAKEQNSAWKNLGNGVKAFVGILAAKVGVDAVKSLVKLSGEMDTVKQTFKSMVDGAGKSSEALLKSIQTATKGTVSTLDIMKSTNLAIGLMGDQVIEKLPQMAKIATAAARLQGKEVSKMLEDIVVASGRQSVMILDNLGISSAVAGQKMEQFAAKLGKTRLQLTETEKRSAFFFAVMEAGKDIMDKTGGSALTLGEKLQVINTNVKETAQNMADELTPEIDDLASAFLDASKKGGFFGTVMIGVNKILSFLIKSVSTVVKVFNLAGNAIGRDFAQIAMIKAKKSVVDFANKMKSELGGDWYQKIIVDPARKSDVIEWNRRKKALNEYVQKYSKAGDSIRNGIQKINDTWVPPPQIPADILKARAKGGGKGLTKTGVGKKAPKKDVGALLTFGGDTRAAELLKLEEQSKKLREIWIGNAKAVIAIDAATVKKREEILLKHNVLRHNMIEGTKQAGINAAQSFENATKASLKEALLGGNGWKAFAASVKDILAGLIADLIVAVGKALVLRAVVGSTTGLGAGSAAGLLTGAIFEKGRVPAFPMGRVPADHELAYVGRKEAIINAESTKANANLLARINASNGQAVQAGGGQALNLTINNPVMSRDYTERVIFKHLEDFARSRGKQVFSTA